MACAARRAILSASFSVLSDAVTIPLALRVALDASELRRLTYMLYLDSMSSYHRCALCISFRSFRLLWRLPSTTISSLPQLVHLLCAISCRLDCCASSHHLFRYGVILMDWDLVNEVPWMYLAHHLRPLRCADCLLHLSPMTYALSGSTSKLSITFFL